MAQNLTADELAGAINDILAEYKGAIDEDIQKAAKDVSRGAKERASSSARQQFGGSGEYAGNWRVKIKNSSGKAEATVYNNKTYRLTHLLEFGHAKVNGGRVDGREHIAPAEQWAIREFEKAIKEAIQK